MTSIPPIPLSALPFRQPGRIVKVGGHNTAHNSAHGSADQDGDRGQALERHLLDLGFEEGAAVEIRHQGAFGGPLAVQVDDRLIALRPADAAIILVSPTQVS